MTPSKLNSLENQAKDFFNTYESVLKATERYLVQKLDGICLRYCNEHNLPPEAVTIQTRRKSISSFVNKLKRRGVLKISGYNDAMTDTVGARIICWFVDDCFGVLEYIKRDESLCIIADSLENFIENPKETGYRSIHILNTIDLNLIGEKVDKSKPIQKIISEIQIRTKLQDSWAEITHEFHYKAKYAGVNNPTYESLLADISDRLAIEDKTLMKFRDAYGKLANGEN